MADGLNTRSRPIGARNLNIIILYIDGGPIAIRVNAISIDHVEMGIGMRAIIALYILHLNMIA